MAETRHRDRPASTVRRSARASNITLFQRDEDEGASGFYVQEMRAYESHQIVDPFDAAYSAGAAGSTTVIKPPFNPAGLMHLPNENNILRQCIDAMVTNIESFGHRLEYAGPEGGEESAEAKAEKARLEALLDQPNGEYTLIELRERLRRDYETFGYAFLEVGRDATGQIAILYHVPAHTMRLCAKDNVAVQVERILTRNGKPAKVKVTKQFRRFVQQVGTQKVYFKEYGDPRSIDPATGLEEAKLHVEDQATEIFHLSLYSPGHSYGLPRWINQLPAIRGSRESEMTNLQFFQDNAIPAMAILVSGGFLSQGTMDEVQTAFTSARGRRSMNRVLVIEATGDDQASAPEGTVPAPKLDIKPLMADRQSDALFQNYDENNQKKVRSSFRLPPIFVGRSEDLTYATAQASLIMAEAQVFGPERNKIDDLFNLHLLSRDGVPPRFWRYRSNPPRIVAPDDIVRALEVLNKAGAITPNIAIGITNELFDLNIKTITAPWGDYPFAIVNELAKQGTLSGIEDITRELDETLPDDTGTNPAAEGKDPEVADTAKKKVVRRHRDLVHGAILVPLRRLGLEE